MRIAQITDLHLRQAVPGDSAIPGRESRRMPELFPQALTAIVAARPDLIAVTGDLVDVPTEWLDPRGSAPPANALELAVADYTLVRRCLDATGLPYRVLPGNHDWEDALWRVFPAEPPEIHVAATRVVSFYDRETVGHLPQRLDASRRLFDACLSDRDATPQIHLQHYLVVPLMNEGYPHTYPDGPAMAERAADCGRVRLSLSGHYHQGVAPIRIGPTTFVTCPAFCAAPFPWRVFDLDREVQVQPHTLAAG